MFKSITFPNMNEFIADHTLAIMKQKGTNFLNNALQLTLMPITLISSKNGFPKKTCLLSNKEITCTNALTALVVMPISPSSSMAQCF